MSPVYLSVVRLAQCFQCLKKWILELNEWPDACPYCGAKNWLWGFESKDTRRIRHGITHKSKPLGPKVPKAKGRNLEKWASDPARAKPPENRYRRGWNIKKRPRKKPLDSAREESEN